MDISRSFETKQNKRTGNAGFTLIEVIVTMFILGVILLVINVIMISLIRVSYTTDVRIKVRQGLEFAGEVMQRNSKSADPEGIEVIDWNFEKGDGVTLDDPSVLNKALSFRISEGSTESDVIFCVTADPDEPDIGVLQARWTEGVDKRIVYLTSPDEIDVDFDFNVTLMEYAQSGTAEILITMKATSAQMKYSGDPIVDNILKQVRIIVRYKEL